MKTLQKGSMKTLNKHGSLKTGEKEMMGMKTWEQVKRGMKTG